MKKVIYLLFVLICFCKNNYGQSTKIFFNNKNNVESLLRSSLMKRTIVSAVAMPFLSNKAIDPNNTGTFNNKLVEIEVNKLFPSKVTSGYLCIDVEDINYDILKASYADTKRMFFSKNQQLTAIKRFADLAKFIKNLRPNVKIGFYGIPFKVYNESQLKAGALDLFTPLLKEVDLILPSLYLPYAPTQSNANKINQFLNRNLSNAFVYGDKLNKEVVPLVWAFTLSPNKEEDRILIPKDWMDKIINQIDNFRSSDGKKVSGIVWWEGVTPFYKKNQHMINQKYIPQTKQRQNWSQRNAFEYYWGK